MKRLMGTEEAARILGITARAIRKKFNKEKIEGQLVDSGKGYGKGGQVLMVWVEDPKKSDQSSVISGQKIKTQHLERYRVHRGEPGTNIVTPLKDGMPILDSAESIEQKENKMTQTGCHQGIGISDPTIRANRVCDPLSPEQEDGRECVASTVPTPANIKKQRQHPGDPLGQCAPATQRNLPAIINDKSVKSTNPKIERIGYLRFAILQKLREDLSKEHPETLPLFKDGNGKPSKTKAIQRFLEFYNSGLILPQVYQEIKKISRATLYNWERAEKSGGVLALIPQYRGAAGEPITEHEKYILLNCLLHQNRLKIGTAIKFTKTFLTYKKIESPSSESKLRRFADDFKKTHYPAWVNAREGAKALNDKCLPYIERDWELLSVGEGLVADGHRLNFQVIHPFTGKPCRATIVLFWDWKSAYPLGWEIMVEENVQCIASALRNAILTLGKIPKWLLIDNGKAFKAKVFTSDVELEDGILYGMFATLDIHTHFSQAYNPQEKPLERFWGTFNNWFERLMDSYTGASIEDKPAWMKRNEKDAQARHKNRVPKIEFVQEALYKWREFYAGQPSRGRGGKIPGEIFEAERGPGVDPAQLYHLMMVKEKMLVHRNGVTFNNWHYYDEALSDIKDYVVGKYSLSDYSEIYCFYRNQFLCIARPIERLHPMISESEAPKDYEAQKRITAIKNRIKRRTKDFLTLIETGKDIDLEHTFRRSPDVAEIVKAIEATQEAPKMVSAFPDEEGTVPILQPPFGRSVDGDSPQRPWFADEYERYRWVMQQDRISRDDRDFIDDFRARSLLYKNTVFTDKKLLDQRVIKSCGEVSDEGRICNRP